MQVNIETEPDTSIPTVTLHVPVDYPETAALTAALKNLSIEAATLTVSQRGQLVHRLTCLLSSRLQICHCQYQTSLFLDQDIDRELDCVSPLT